MIDADKLELKILIEIGKDTEKLDLTTNSKRSKLSRVECQGRINAFREVIEMMKEENE